MELCCGVGELLLVRYGWGCMFFLFALLLLGIDGSFYLRTMPGFLAFD